MLDAEDVFVLLDDQFVASEDQAEAALSVVTAMARSYTRGHGFTGNAPEADVAAVILTATLRLLRNPSQSAVREEMGPLVVDWRGGFTGWTLVELGVLNRYRERAQ